MALFSVMILYKTGELAKKANVTIRTIRYYDSIDLLKPSKIDENNGYRLYDENDFFKLQKILCLKSLGFDLDEIKTMTVTDNFTSMEEALRFQMLSIDKKIDELNKLKNNIRDLSNSLSESNEVDWSKLMYSLQMNNLEQDIIDQYKNSTNVSIRIKLHRLYSKNEESWYKWLFKNYKINKNSKVLELGCGDGSLWLENLDKVKGDITLSDISSGMLSDAKEVLGDKFRYDVFDCHKIPYDDNSFDVVIANHMLFYVKEIDSVLREIKRVLKPNGVLYCSTYGSKHMKENTELVKEFNPKITLSNVNLYEIFGLDNGNEILSKYFKEIKTLRYEDYLEVSNSNDLLNYILSCHGNQNEYLKDNISDFKKLIERKFKNGAFHITKDAGMFVAK